ncbi:hypothetical protein LIER_33194 [Lithospermum erythrorhizon]|uniref:Uncharacterized protein n=1 Tax=Lithospermum erythrorhizon TaxID=34254 RepID=A0AAV3S1N6_LITER
MRGIGDMVVKSRWCMHGTLQGNSANVMSEVDAKPTLYTIRKQCKCDVRSRLHADAEAPTTSVWRRERPDAYFLMQN